MERCDWFLKNVNKLADWLKTFSALVRVNALLKNQNWLWIGPEPIQFLSCKRGLRIKLRERQEKQYWDIIYILPTSRLITLHI